MRLESNEQFIRPKTKHGISFYKKTLPLGKRSIILLFLYTFFPLFIFRIKLC